MFRDEMKRKGKTEEEQEENRERKKENERTNRTEPNKRKNEYMIKKNHIFVSRSRQVVSLLFIFYTAYNYILYYFISN